MTHPNQPSPKFLTKEQLVSVVASIPNGSLVQCNSAGNLSVMDSEHNYKGWIEFEDEGSYEPAIGHSSQPRAR